MNYSINPTELYQLIHQDAIFIDIRETQQFNDLHIKNFINIPYAQFTLNMPLFPKNKPLYILCNLGQQAKQLVTQLRQQNYQAFYIDGGFQAFLNIPSSKYY